MNEGISHTPPEIAVAEAMSCARKVFEEIALRKYTTPLTSHFGPEARLERISRGECENGSIIAIKFLQQMYGNEFDRLMLVKGHGDFKEGYGNHVYFLAHSSTSDTWHAGSPANHTPFQSESPFNFMISSDNLEEVFREMSDKDGGTWPFASEVLASLPEAYQAPKFLEMASGAVEATIFTFNYDFERFDPDSVISPEGLLITRPPFKMEIYDLDSRYQEVQVV